MIYIPILLLVSFLPFFFLLQEKEKLSKLELKIPI